MTLASAFDDPHADTGLSQWATITQVSTTLGIQRNAVRSALRRAAYHQEPWIKKEVPPENGVVVYLIDTTHPTYLSHAERWKGHGVLQPAGNEDASLNDSWSSSTTHTQAPPPPFADPSLPYYISPSTWESAESRSMSLSSWLCLMGLRVFTNALDESSTVSWQWQWYDQHGQGYGSKDEALIAALGTWLRPALEHREHVKRDEDLLSASTHTVHTPKKSFWPFHSRRAPSGSHLSIS